MGRCRKALLVGGLAVVIALPGPAPALEMRPILTLDACAQAGLEAVRDDLR
jgi:hypothetical protein